MNDAPFIVIGGGGHAKSVISALIASGAAVAGYVDGDANHPGHDILGAPLLGDDSLLPSLVAAGRPLAIGLGQMAARKSLFTTWSDRGADFPPVIHPQSIVCPSATLAAGAQVMAGAIVQPLARVGENVLLNTGCRIDHDCVISAHAVLGPGATLCGNVMVGPEAWVGANATVLQGLRIGSGAELGAGALLLDDLRSGARAFGVPATERPR